MDDALEAPESGDFIEVTVKDEPNPFSGATGEGSSTISGHVIEFGDDVLELAPVGSAPRRIPRSRLLAWRPAEAPIPNVGVLDPAKRPVIVRVYPGQTQSAAASIYADEATYLARHGYLPTAQSWAVGEPGLGRVLALGLVGAVALRPKGALTVTYVHRSMRDPV